MFLCAHQQGQSNAESLALRGQGLSAFRFGSSARQKVYGKGRAAAWNAIADRLHWSKSQDLLAKCQGDKTKEKSLKACFRCRAYH